MSSLEASRKLSSHVLPSYYFKTFALSFPLFLDILFCLFISFILDFTDYLFSQAVLISHVIFSLHSCVPVMTATARHFSTSADRRRTTSSEYEGRTLADRGVLWQLGGTTSSGQEEDDFCRRERDISCGQEEENF